MALPSAALNDQSEVLLTLPAAIAFAAFARPTLFTLTAMPHLTGALAPGGILCE